MFKIICFLFFFFFGFFLLQAEDKLENPAEKPLRFNAVLVTVNGDPITLLDLFLKCGGDEKALRQMTDGGVLPSQIEAFRKQTLENIIDRKLIWADYLKYKHPIPKQMIEDALCGMASMLSDGSREGLKEKLKGLGVTLESLREQATEQIATDMMVQEYCYRRVFTTPRQLDSYYQTHIAEFTDPPVRELAMILISLRGRNPDPVETADRIQAELERNPAAFERLSVSYSDAPSADSGGVMGRFTRAQLRVEFETALDSLPSGRRVTDSILIPEGVAFLKILNTDTANIRPFEAVREIIRKQIEAPQRAAKLNAYLNKLRRDAIIRYYSAEESVVAEQFDQPKIDVEKRDPVIKEPPPPGAVGTERRVVR